MQPEGHHLAELNIGRLTAPTDDPRVAYRRERDSVARFAGMILGSLCAACSLWIGSGPALAENQRLPDETYDEIFRLHLAGVANENCKGLAASASDMDARWAANTRNTRNATGLPYPDIAVIYETKEFDKALQARIDAFLKRHPGADICLAIDAERKNDPQLRNLIRKQND